jgi:hypothetical protein
MQTDLARLHSSFASMELAQVRTDASITRFDSPVTSSAQQCKADRADVALLKAEAGRDTPHSDDTRTTRSSVSSRKRAAPALQLKLCRVGVSVLVLSGVQVLLGHLPRPLLLVGLLALHLLGMRSPHMPSTIGLCTSRICLTLS